MVRDWCFYSEVSVRDVSIGKPKAAMGTDDMDVESRTVSLFWATQSHVAVNATVD